MEYSYKKLTDQATGGSASNNDLLFLNQSGKLVQVTLDQIIQATGLRGDLTQHKNGSDHDSRYYTKTQVDAGYYTKTQMDTKLNALQPEITCDDTPTSGSTNPVTSGGVYTALADKQNAIPFKKLTLTPYSGAVSNDNSVVYRYGPLVIINISFTAAAGDAEELYTLKGVNIRENVYSVMQAYKTTKKYCNVYLDASDNTIWLNAIVDKGDVVTGQLIALTA